VPMLWVKCPCLAPALHQAIALIHGQPAAEWLNAVCGKYQR